MTELGRTVTHTCSGGQWSPRNPQPLKRSFIGASFSPLPHADTGRFLEPHLQSEHDDQPEVSCESL